MEEYKSKEVVRAIKFDPEEPSVYEQLEGLGCLVNRGHALVKLPHTDAGIVPPGWWVIEDHPDYRLRVMSNTDFLQRYELAEELVS